MSVTLTPTVASLPNLSFHPYPIIDDCFPRRRAVPSFLVDAGLALSFNLDNITPYSKDHDISLYETLGQTSRAPVTIGRPNRYLALQLAEAQCKSESLEPLNIGEPALPMDGDSTVRGSPPPTRCNSPSTPVETFRHNTPSTQTDNTEALPSLRLLRGSAQEFNINGFRRGDPSVTWDDETPSSSIVPLHLRHGPSQLTPSRLPLPTVGNAQVGIANALTPATLPIELNTYLAKREARIKHNAAMDIWRTKHAAAIIQHHHDTIFTPAATDRNYALKNYHMSEAYHGQKSKPAARAGADRTEGVAPAPTGAAGLGAGMGANGVLRRGAFGGRGGGRGRGRMATQATAHARVNGSANDNTHSHGHGLNNEAPFRGGRGGANGIGRSR